MNGEVKKDTTVTSLGVEKIKAEEANTNGKISDITTPMSSEVDNVEAAAEELEETEEIVKGTTMNGKVETAAAVAISEADKIRAGEVKEEANKLFQAKHYSDAIEKYTEAIELDPNVAAFYANRAAAYMKTEAYGYAVADADKAVSIDPSYVKGYYRRAAANMALLKFKDALSDFRIVVKKAPSDKNAKERMTECTKIVRKIEFEKAIELDSSKKAISDTLDVSSWSVEESYDGPRIPDDGITEEAVNELMQSFKDQKRIHKKYACQIILAVKKATLSESSLVDITIPEDARLIVCGDVHGQYYDLLHIFEINGPPSEKNMYLFNGDFVDRGSFSVEVILTLFAFKWLHPNSLFLNRGNHETDDMNKVYGFEGEVKAKFSYNNMFALFSETFATLPLAHVIGEKIFVVHGGLFSRDGVTLDDIRKIDRFKSKPDNSGLMSEILWADPQIKPGRSPSKRGVGLQFGPDVTESFLKDNNLDLLIRSHEVKEGGYMIEHNGKCITVFSAPNYCDSMGNKGAFIIITPDLQLDYKTFDAVPHPNIRPMAYSSQFSGLLS